MTYVENNSKDSSTLEDTGNPFTIESPDVEGEYNKPFNEMVKILEERIFLYSSCCHYTVM